MSSEPPSAGLEGFQAEIAEVALRAIDQHGFALAGAGALLAHGVISRPTQDLDLFTPAGRRPGPGPHLGRRPGRRRLPYPAARRATSGTARTWTGTAAL